MALLLHLIEPGEQGIEIGQRSLRQFDARARFQSLDLLVPRQMRQHGMTERGAVGGNARARPAIHLVAVEARADAREINHVAAVEDPERGRIADIRHEIAQQRFDDRPQRSVRQHGVAKVETGNPEDLLSGQIDLAFDNVPLLLPQVKTGQLAMLATATPKRAAFDPETPAVAEFLPGFEAVAWHGFFVPAATPKPIVEKLSAEIRAFMQQPETVQKMAELGATAAAVDSEPFAAYIAAETARWKKVIEAANIKLE